MTEQSSHPRLATFSVVVPTLNEVQNINALLEGIIHAGGPSLQEVIVVDDGSTDGTQEKVRSWEERGPVRLICRTAKDGLAGAVLAGARAARSEIIVVMDGDLSHPAEVIPQLVKPIEQGAQEMVVGSRYVAGGTTPDWPAFRRVCSRLAAILAWPLTDVRDSLSGFFAVRRALLLALPDHVVGFKIGLEILVREGVNLRVKEVPIKFKDRQQGRSKMSGHVIASYLRQIIGFFLARLRNLPALSAAVLALWCIVMLGICARTAASPYKNTVFATYEAAGASWKSGSSFYRQIGGFVYSPLVAASFVPYTFLPDWMSNVAWRVVNLLLYATAVWWWLRRGMHEGIPRSRYGIVFLLLLPLSIGNLNNGQANPMVIGLLMASAVGVRYQRWWVAAFCIAIATYLKIYPLVWGLLVIVMFPRPFAWRLGAALTGLGAGSFLLQHPSYVLQQYHEWWTTRLEDHRHLYALRLAPRDLWLLLHELHLSLSEPAYQALQAGAGALIACWAWAGRRRGFPSSSLITGIFSLTVCWMLLLGPASESSTYILLAPVTVLEFVSALQRRPVWWRRVLLFSSLGLLLSSLAINSFTHANRDPGAMVIQPLAALLFTIYLAAGYFGRAGRIRGSQYSTSATSRPLPASRRSPSLVRPVGAGHQG